jgi:hypothetical protein
MFYLAARRLGIQPGEFWDMTLPEFFAEVTAQERGTTGPALTDEERDRYKRWLDGE